jgi:RNA polymerase sigma factor FliA
LDTREEMIVRNLALVTFVVRRMIDESGTAPIDREDAIAYGTEGLIQAVDSFDPERGTTFASFAIRRIRGAILDAIRRNDVLPRSLRRNARDLEKASLELANMLGRWPTHRELALKLAMPVDQIRQIIGHSGSRVLSLEKLMSDATENSLTPWEAHDTADERDPASTVDRQAILELLDSALGSLPERDQQLLRMRYAKEMAFHEIGRLMNLSESRVCQLHKRILSGLNKRLKHEIGAAA